MSKKIDAEKQPIINIKLDRETKDKLDTLVFIKKSTIQDLCLQMIKDNITANEDIINKVENLRE